MLGAIHLLAYSWQQVTAATIKNCIARAQFVVPAVSAQEINPSEVDADEEAADDSDCEALLAEVLDRQGDGDRVPFSAFCDVDNDVETCEDLTDSDIVNSLSTKLCSASDGEDDDNAELEYVPCPSVGEAARALDVMRLFAEKRGLMDTLAFHLDGFETAVVAARPPKRQTKVTDFWALFPQNKEVFLVFLRNAFHSTGR
ncbi:hypothetical protein HPB49_016338 [Dermacentor silvarum]|uniref:Uncharacterized protein n=1 Tax=Dermacentor silvarum TaxID=543639 RepID=A0ACB8E298_DERSI|nr:hypothetical protein HPB49_016338 [Dermacentor silvarum]